MPNVIHKTRARGQWVDGVYWRSIAELERYRELKRREEAGLIHDLTCQPRFPIRNHETGEKACDYIGDFSYLNNTYNQVVEDVKGIKSDVYKLKKKLVKVFCGVHITEVVARPVSRNKQIVRYRWFVDGVEE